MNNTSFVPEGCGEFCINQIIRLSLMVLTVIAGFIGNALVAFIIVIKKKRRTNDDIFLLNLASADFLNIAFDTGRFIYHLSYLRVDAGLPPMKSLFWCKFYWAILLPVPFCAGIFTITAMSIHRCWVILNPFKPKIRLRWINLCVLSTWVIPIIIYLPTTISSVNQRWGCIYQGWSDEGKKAYSYFTAIVQYPLPLLVIMSAYLKIGVYLRRPRVPSQSFVAKGGTLRRPGDETRKDSISMTKTVGAIVLLFAIMLLPLQISKVAFYSGIKTKIWVFALWDYGDVLSSLHSAINPYLYAIRTPFYRKTILSWFKRQPSTGNASTTQPRERFQSFSPSSATTEIELNGIDVNTKTTEDEKPRAKGMEPNTSGYDMKL